MSVIPHTLRWLKKNFPLDARLYYREVPQSELKDHDGVYDGDAEWTGKSYIIRVEESQHDELKRQTLMHEFAHCLATEIKGPVTHHKSWKVCIGEILAAWEAHLGNP